MEHSTIRGSFIRGYAERNDQYLFLGQQLINQRNEQLRELNRDFGYSEPDGSFSIGCKTHVDQGYKLKYDEIEARFRIPYNDQLPGLYRWCQDSGMTVFEYLLIDDIREQDLKELKERAVKFEDWQLRPITEKARLLVSRLKRVHSIGEMRSRLDMEIANRGYAAARCRSIFGIKPWDLARQKAILDYGREWKKALNQVFDGLRAA
jgi:hypothetical protein